MVRRLWIKGIRQVKLDEVSGVIATSNVGGIVYYDGHELEQFIQKDPNHRKGYKCVAFERKQFYVHKLVAMAWLSNVEGKKYVRHLDGNTLNNDAKNLEWANSYTKVGPRPKTFRGRSKIPYDQVEIILERIRNGETHSAIAADYDVHAMSISRIKKRYG